MRDLRCWLTCCYKIEKMPANVTAKVSGQLRCMQQGSSCSMGQQSMSCLVRLHACIFLRVVAPGTPRGRVARKLLCQVILEQGILLLGLQSPTDPAENNCRYYTHKNATTLKASRGQCLPQKLVSAYTSFAAATLVEQSRLKH